MTPKKFKLKYIRYDDFNFLVFSPGLNHAAEAARHGIDPENIQSAGFISAIEIELYGESVSLGKKCLAEDQLHFNVMNGDR